MKRCAFVGSTLPFDYICNKKNLKLDLVICNTNELKKSFEKGFMVRGINLPVVSLGDNRLIKFFSFLNSVCLYLSVD